MCLFYQSHPLAHEGLHIDYVDDTLPINIMQGCRSETKWTKPKKRLHLEIQLALMASISNIWIEIGLPKIVRTFSLHIIKKSNCGNLTERLFRVN